tara:strand:+ start:5705 stop:6334 length:630 start_codon:yes stop_codon:yes gene_type:complete
MNIFGIVLYLYTSLNTIYLTTNNVISLYGNIDQDMANKISLDINRQPYSRYIYIHSNGGFVESGNYIKSQIQNYKLPCITHNALSMAAVIFLGCEQRYITPDAKLMFHNLSTYKHTISGLKRDYYNFISKKLNITRDKMFHYLQKDYYLYGSDIVKNIHSEMIHIQCSHNLTQQTFEKDGYIWSKCPNIRYPLRKSFRDFRCQSLGCKN